MGETDILQQRKRIRADPGQQNRDSELLLLLMKCSSRSMQTTSGWRTRFSRRITTFRCSSRILVCSASR